MRRSPARRSGSSTWRWSPYARKFWPEIMLGWSRLLSGHIRDSRVGRDVIAGLVFGMAWALLFVARSLVPQRFGHDAPRPLLGSAVNTLAGVDSTIELWLTTMLEQIVFVLGIAFLFVALRLLTRRTWLAVPLGMYVLFTYWSSFGQAAAYYWIEMTLEVAIVALFTFVLIRFGLLAAAIAAVAFRLGHRRSADTRPVSLVRHAVQLDAGRVDRACSLRLLRVAWRQAAARRRPARLRSTTACTA